MSPAMHSFETTLFPFPRRLPRLVVAAVLFATTLTAQGAVAQGRDAAHWVATWAASPQRAGAPLQVNGQTVRQILHVSSGGPRDPCAPVERVRRDRTRHWFGTGRSVGWRRRHRPGQQPKADVQRDIYDHYPCRSAGRERSDRIRHRGSGQSGGQRVPPRQRLPDREHTESVQTTYISGFGDFTQATTFGATTANAFYVVAGVEVSAHSQARAIVALGDSVTVGFGSTPDANRRWPDLLAERLQSGAAPHEWP